MSLPLRLREATEDDLNFIFSSWLKSFRDSQRVPSKRGDVFFNWPRPESEIFFRYQKQLIVKLLQKSNCIVACNPDEDTQVYGFIVFEPNVVHYTYVKTTFRKMGICKLMLSKAVTSPEPAYTHFTYACEFIAPKLNAKYNPYLLSENS